MTLNRPPSPPPTIDTAKYSWCVYVDDRIHSIHEHIRDAKRERMIYQDTHRNANIYIARKYGILPPAPKPKIIPWCASCKARPSVKLHTQGTTSPTGIWLCERCGKDRDALIAKLLAPVIIRPPRSRKTKKLVLDNPES